MWPRSQVLLQSNARTPMPGAKRQINTRSSVTSAANAAVCPTVVFLFFIKKQQIEMMFVKIRQQFHHLNTYIIFTFMFRADRSITRSPPALIRTKDWRVPESREQTWRNISRPAVLQIFAFVFRLEYFLLLLKYWYADKSGYFLSVFLSTEGRAEMKKEEKCNMAGRLALFSCFTTNS